jgi:uncharacterized protein YndB with AHSA1/START domain
MMSQLSVEAEAASRADPEVVWSLIADATSYVRWGPWSAGGYKSQEQGPSRVGSVQWFRYGRRTTIVEEILDVAAPHRLAYTVVSGLPVRNYRAEVTLTPLAPTGTSIRWEATWDRTLMGRLVQRKLRQVYRQVVAALVAAADEQVGPASRR